MSGLKSVAAHIDYYRATWKEGYYPDDKLGNLNRCIRQTILAIGGPREEARRATIQGYYGGITQGMFIGTRSDGILLQASGVAADTLAQLAYDPTGIPRLDIAVTVWATATPSVCIQEAARQALEFRSKRGGRPSKVRLINGYGDGDTLYVGARGKNSSMLRIYDKGAESKEEIYEGATRYEVELSDTHARQGYEAVREAGYGHGACLAVAMSYFAVKGVRIPVPPGTPIIEAWSLPKAQSNLEGRLKWLRESVAPALDLLREAGYSEHNIAAVLGLEV